MIDPNIISLAILIGVLYIIYRLQSESHGLVVRKPDIRDLNKIRTYITSDGNVEIGRILTSTSKIHNDIIYVSYHNAEIKEVLFIVTSVSNKSTV